MLMMMIVTIHNTQTIVCGEEDEQTLSQVRWDRSWNWLKKGH